MNIQNECHEFIQSILGFKIDLTIEEVIEMLNEVLNSLNEKKKYDLVKKYLDDLKFIKSDNVEIYRQNREKILYSNLKIDNKTRYSNPVLNDNLTPTIHAFYYCDKSRQILSDKEAAALKVMNLDNKYELVDKDCSPEVNANFIRGNTRKDFDQESFGSNSNSNPQLSFNNSFVEKGDVTKNLTGHKRRYSLKVNGNKRIRNKIQRSNNRKYPYENNIDDNFKNNTFNNNGDRDEEEDEDKEYCIPACLLGRKYQEANDLMISCDLCSNWYHPKCIKMSDEEFDMVKNSEWLCGDCKNNK